MSDGAAVSTIVLSFLVNALHILSSFLIALFYVTMLSAHGHRTSGSMSQNHRAQLANAYNELGKELSSSKVRVVGNYTLGKVIGEGKYYSGPRPESGLT